MELRDQSSAEEVRQDVTLTESAADTPIENTEIIEVAPVSDTNKPDEEVASEPTKQMTKDEIVDALEAISQKDGAEINRDEVAHLKQVFYAIRKNELLQEKQEFLDKGNEESAFAPMPDALEEKMHGLLNVIKEKKAEFMASQDAERKANLEKKLAIIDELIKMADDTDNVNRHFARFRELTNEFKTVGEVPATDMTEVWRNYQAAVERFYDQLKVNKDLRDYDFKKNLDSKMLLIDEAKRLVSEPDVITAFRRLQELHDKWRQTGPVAKEKREEIWGEFKDISAEINKRYQAHFEERKAEELRNEQAKTAICERIEALDYTQIKNYAGWDDLTKVIIEAQAEWKTLGFASKKMNNMLFARFRGTCDKFFAAKAEYFKSTKEALSANLAKKVSLCERAEALKDSTDWRKTSDELVELQKEWKTIGAVPKKHSDSVWRRFQTACDAFFDAKKAATSGVRSTQQANLKAKREIIEALGNIAADAPREEAVKAIKELQAKWNQIGHVPFRDKDKIYDAYREKVNGLYSRLNMRESRENFAGFESSLEGISGDENRLYRERERLMRAFEQKRAELQTVENNMGFFSSKSKAGESMMRELQHRVQRVKDDLEMLEKKIALIDSKL